MKYYLYVSNTKVDMLSDQIPTRLRVNIATELKIDLKVFSTTFSESPPEATLFSRLEVVTKYIEKHEQVGTVDKPEKFFRGNIPMRWVPELVAGEGALPLPIVYFGGNFHNTVLGLGGSRKHIIGAVADAHDELKGYYNSSTLWFLIKELVIKDHQPQDEVVNYLNFLSQGDDDALAITTEIINQLVLENIIATTKAMTGPLQKMDFLAKRVVEGYADKKHVLLGTPIYVALDD